MANALGTGSIYESIMRMDPEELAAFRRRLRRRYSREDILGELQACAERLGTSPTMREFADDPKVTLHPQTVVEHFGSWNAAKREAGLRPRRLATREELVTALQDLATTLGRTPTAKDLEGSHKGLPRKGVFVKQFGSVRDALVAAGFDAPTKDERLARSVDYAAAIFQRSGRLPSFRDWERLRGNRDDLLTAWQIYRTFEGCDGAWSAFQFAVSERAASMPADLVG